MKSEFYATLPQFAFPHVVPLEDSQGVSLGMTLRDYFAAKALQGILADTNTGGDHADLAADAYAYADAMMKAREVKEAPPAPSAQAQE